jgi:ABC-2 type transport system ATP-binding protein
VLQIKNLTKKFNGRTVVDNISFDVPENCVFGFIGANGAGKTTTMKMVLGLLAADSGEIHICGERVRFGATKTNRLVGYLSDVPEFYNYMRPKEYLKLCGEIVGMSSAAIKKRSEELLSLVGLSGTNKKIGGFYRGMKQRLGMAQALLGEPKLLICDEPTSALDPIGRRDILDILQQIKGKTTVIFSTHILSDVERICDRVAVISSGKITMQKSMSELRVPHKTKAVTLEFAAEVDSDEVVRVLTESNLAPSSYEIPAISIEDIFLEVAAK